GCLLQVGFQRRFDPGYRAARDALREGRVGRLHTVRTVSSDPAPPPAAYVPLSGGLYRDCLIHDFDIVRWVTGLEITEVYAAGALARLPRPVRRGLPGRTDRVPGRRPGPDAQPLRRPGGAAGPPGGRGVRGLPARAAAGAGGGGRDGGRGRGVGRPGLARTE